MTGTERRDAIIQILTKQSSPVSGTALAKELHVSRQVIVQDIALLRTSDYPILSTNKGYFIPSPSISHTRTFKCQHNDEQTEEELNLIVDQGGIVENVYVNHKAYGHIEAALNLQCRRDIEEFLVKIRTGKSSLLKNITSDYHYHLVRAADEESLDRIESLLKSHGFLVE